MPQKTNLNYEERLQLITDYLEGKIGYSEAEKIYSRFGFILEQYKYNGSAGLKLANGKNVSYQADIKLAAVMDYLTGKGSLRTICAKYKIPSDSILRRWIKVYNEHGDFNNRKHSGGGSYMKKARKTTYEERILIAKDCIESGKNY